MGKMIDVTVITPPAPASVQDTSRFGKLRPSPMSGLDVWAFIVVNLVVITAMWIRHGGLDLWNTSFGKLEGLGQITALWGSFFILGELMLIARVPWIERRYGMDKLLIWHRLTGFASVTLLSAHVLFTTLGYAVAPPSDARPTSSVTSSFTGPTCWLPRPAT